VCSCKSLPASYILIQIKFWNRKFTTSLLHKALKSVNPNKIYSTKQNPETSNNKHLRVQDPAYTGFRAQNPDLFNYTIRMVVSFSGFTEIVKKKIKTYNATYLNHPIILFTPDNSHYGSLMQEKLKFFKKVIDTTTNVDSELTIDLAKWNVKPFKIEVPVKLPLQVFTKDYKNVAHTKRVLLGTQITSDSTQTKKQKITVEDDPIEDMDTDDIPLNQSDRKAVLQLDKVWDTSILVENHNPNCQK